MTDKLGDTHTHTKIKENRAAAWQSWLMHQSLFILEIRVQISAPTEKNVFLSVCVVFEFKSVGC